MQVGFIVQLKGTLTKKCYTAATVFWQRLTFCGVNAHFQNSIAEKAIQDLCVSARK